MPRARMSSVIAMAKTPSLKASARLVSTKRTVHSRECRGAGSRADQSRLCGAAVPLRDSAAGARGTRDAERRVLAFGLSGGALLATDAHRLALGLRRKRADRGARRE